MERRIIAQVQSEQLVSDRRERIIRAAITVFHIHGFHGTTTADIAQEAGLSQSNLYNYVSTKQDVLFLVCDHLVGTFENLLEEVAGRHADPHARLIEAVKAVIRMMITCTDEVQLLYNETHSLESADRTTILTSISRFITSFQHLLGEYERAGGQISSCDRRLVANLLSFVPAMVGLRHWDLGSRELKDLEADLLHFILAGLGIPEVDPNHFG